MTNLNLALTLSLNDRLVAPLQRALKEVAKGVEAIEKDLLAAERAGNKANQTLSAMQGPSMAAKQAAELARNTQNALSLAERLKTAFSAAANVVKGVNTGIAAFQAAKFVVAAPLQQSRTYEKQLADAANIAYSGKDVGERRAGMASMNASVIDAVRTGGGTREAALTGLNSLFAANIDKDVVSTLLPTVQKYSTAGNADPKNIADLVIFGLKSLKLSPDQIPLMLDKTLASTNVGSMELDNLAKWMPQVGAAGGAAGLTGMKGYEQMLAGVQVSRLTAGTKDEAGTNFKDLLSMLNGHALMTAAKKMGIDATGSLAKHVGEGGNALSGALLLSDYVVNQDPRQIALQKKLNASGIQRDKTGQPIYTPEQEDLMRQQATLFAGSSLGKLFHNQQSMQALVALRNNRDYFKENVAATGLATGQIGEGNMDLIRSTNQFKQEQAENEKLFALTQGLGPVNSALGALAEGTTAVYRQYPGLAAAMETTKLALSALAAAAIAAGGAALLQNGGSLGAAWKTIAGGAAATEATAGGAAVAGGLGMAGAATVGGVAAGGLAATMFAGNIVANNSEAFANMGADAGDTAFAAAIMNASQSGGATDKRESDLAAERAALTAQTQALKDIAQRPIQVILDGRQIAAQADSYNEMFARRN